MPSSVTERLRTVSLAASPVVGLGGGRAQLLGGELAGGRDDHLLVLARGEVELAARRRPGRALRLWPALLPAAKTRLAAPAARKPDPAPR